MKSCFYVFLMLFSPLLSLLAQSDMIAISGNYQGRNLYIQNPFTDGTSGFCVTEVRVNGNPTKDEIQSSAFEIDFKTLGLQLGSPVEIQLYHKSICKPKVLNPEVLKPKATFELTDIKLSPEGKLEWSTKSETGKLNYIVEQYRWNKWLKIGEVEGLGSQESNSYNIKVNMHSGKNQVRVKQIDYTNQPRISKAAEAAVSICNIEFGPIKPTNEILFTCSDTKTAIETMYELYDQYGNVVKKGFSNKFEISDLKKGAYYLNYDNKMGEFSKK